MKSKKNKYGEIVNPTRKDIADFSKKYTTDRFKYPNIQRVKNTAKDIVSKVKSEYGYFKAGVKAEVNAKRKALIDENKLRMKNIREGNSEENLKLDSYHQTRGKNFWKKRTGGRMG